MCYDEWKGDRMGTEGCNIVANPIRLLGIQVERLEKNKIMREVNKLQEGRPEADDSDDVQESEAEPRGGAKIASKAEAETEPSSFDNNSVPKKTRGKKSKGGILEDKEEQGLDDVEMKDIESPVSKLDGEETPKMSRKSSKSRKDKKSKADGKQEEAKTVSSEEARKKEKSSNRKRKHSESE